MSKLEPFDHEPDKETMTNLLEEAEQEQQKDWAIGLIKRYFPDKACSLSGSVEAILYGKQSLGEDKVIEILKWCAEKHVRVLGKALYAAIDTAIGKQYSNNVRRDGQRGGEKIDYSNGF